MSSRRGDLHVLRYIPSDTPMHRLWAGTKLVAVVVLAGALFARPTWTGVAVLAFVQAVALVVTRPPRGVAPRLPRWLFVGLGVVAFLSLGLGGPPVVHVGVQAVELGGILNWARFTSVAVLLILGATLVGWTTQLGDVGPAVRVLGAPARLVRLPVDEIATVIGLCVRCLPLLIEEMRTLTAARAVRRPEVEKGIRPRVREVHDLLVTALVSSVRRAQDMAQAMQARGGARPGPREPVRLRAGDAVALAFAAAAAAAIVLL